MRITNKFVKKFYDDYVSSLEDGYEYQRWHSSSVNENHLFQTEKSIISCLVDRKNINEFLEIGCGAGTFTGTFSKVCDSLTAVDISKEMLDYAKNKSYSGKDVKFIQADFMELIFKNHSYDFIALIRCFEYFSNKPKTIKKIDSLLIKKGRFLLITKNPSYLGNFFKIRNSNDQILHSDKISVNNLKDVCDTIFKGKLLFKPVVFNFFFIPIKRLKIYLNNYFFNKYYLSEKIPRLLLPFIESYLLLGKKD